MSNDYRQLLADYIGKDKKSHLSANEVGKRVGISGARVRQYVGGTDGNGRPATVDTARMVQLADALRITNDELRRHGRADAAIEREARSTEPARGGPLLPRLLRLRDELNAVIGDVRERGL